MRRLKPYSVWRCDIVLASPMVLSLLAAWSSMAPTPPYRWRNVEIVGGGFVSGLSFHPRAKDVLYARTDIGGAYRWNPRTSRWVPLQDWLTQDDWNLYGVESIGLDPTDPRRLYLAVGTYTNSWGGNGAILRSRDQGRTFERTDMPFKFGGNEDGRSIGERLAVDPNHPQKLYVGTRHNGLWRSEDRGKSWAQDFGFPVTGPTNGVGIGFVLFDGKSGRRGRATPTIYAAGSQLWVSQNAGKSWATVPGQPVGFLPHHGSIAADGTLYVTYGNGPGPNGMTDGAVWRYQPKEGTWKNITPPEGTGFGYAGLAVDRRNPRRVVVSTMDRWSKGDDIFESLDRGESWGSLRESSLRDSSRAPFLNWDRDEAEFGHWIGDVEIDPFRPNRMLYVTGATIWGTDEASKPVAKWKVWAGGLEETAVIDLISPPEGPSLISGLGDIGGFRHDDLTVSPPGGMTKNPMLSNTDSLDFAEFKPSNIVRVGRAGRGQRRGGMSRDGGQTWQMFGSEPPASQGSGTVAISAGGEAIVWTPEGSLPSRSEDGGQTWEPIAGAPARLRLVADRANAARFYGFDSGSSQLYASFDSGRSVQRVGAPIVKLERAKLRATPGVEGDLWLLSESGLRHSIDGGVSFQAVPGVTRADSLGFGRPRGVGGYPTLFLIGGIAGKRGIYRTDDLAKPWLRIDDVAHRFGTAGTIVGDPRVWGRCYVGTNGRGVLIGEPNPVR